MSNREALLRLGWTDELIDAFERARSSTPLVLVSEHAAASFDTTITTTVAKLEVLETPSVVASSLVVRR